MTRPITKILITDPGGTPKDWVTREDAIHYAAKNDIVWIPPSATKETIFGGTCVATGELSQVEIASIMALRSPMLAKLMATGIKTPKVSNKALFARDHHRCAYCGNYFDTEVLTKDHIKPKTNGGKNTWMNLITACKPCNGRKADRTPERAGMPLRYKPYVPSTIEFLWLKNRSMTEEQIKYLEQYDMRGAKIAAGT